MTAHELWLDILLFIMLYVIEEKQEEITGYAKKLIEMGVV
jgi:hypothetical protein